jgi:laminin alpha 3/5
MTDFDSCNQVTGECVKCLNNTAGPGCAECAYWHYGDPIVRKDCKPCECDQCGSSSCDAVTGECKCKKNGKYTQCFSVNIFF